MSAIEDAWNVASEMEFRVKQKPRITIINPFLWNLRNIFLSPNHSNYASINRSCFSFPFLCFNCICLNIDAPPGDLQIEKLF